MVDIIRRELDLARVEIRTLRHELDELARRHQSLVEAYEKHVHQESNCQYTAEPAYRR